MKNPWKKISSKRIYKNSWISVVEDQVITPDKKRGIYGLVGLGPKGNSVGVVALSKKGEIFLIREYRYPLEMVTTEIPRGACEKGETPLFTAKKELREEAGVTAKKWKLLGYVNTSPGIINEFAHLFLATDIKIGKPQPEGVELQEVLKLPLIKAYRWCIDGRINDAISIAAILRAKDYLKKQL
ncbi:MAG: NUDIX hydrolase [Patescibacteria group bacterium]|jgi:8-oxo-dGTP pyrophosphatase MutT (NUDIX family)